VTRPLARHLLDHSLVAYPYTAFDVPLNAWILSWVSRALVTQPGALFDANIYHPEPDALAYTEHMLGSAPFFSPVFLATGNPALALNVMILAGLVLSAVGTYWVTWRWTGSAVAAAFAGLIVGFQETQVRALGPNLQTTQYLPFVLLFLDRVLAGGGIGPTIGLTAALTGQSLASYYYAYPTVLATTLSVAAVAVARDTRRSARTWYRVTLALVGTALVLGVVSVPYFRVAARGIETLYTMAGLFEEAPTRLAQLGTLLTERVGFPAAALALAGAATAVARTTDPATRRRVLVLLAWIVVACVLATGPTLRVSGTDLAMPDRLLDRWAPGFAALRDRRRLFVVAPPALGVLAGIGIATLARLLRSPRYAAAVITLVALAITAAGRDMGPCRLMPLPTGEQVPPVYREIARRERGPVLELPVGVTLKDVSTANRNAWYDYFSIFHWRDLVNGYASYWPAHLKVVLPMAHSLPMPRALDNLVDCTGVRWIVAHTVHMSAAEREAFLAPPTGLRIAGSFGEDLLLEVERRRGIGDCPRSLREPMADTTIEGTPLVSLPAAARRAAIERVDAPQTMQLWPRAFPVPVRIRNTGTSPWPAVARDDAYLVQLSYAWRDRAGNAIMIPWRLWTRLPVDLRPGEAIDVPLAVRPPGRPGSYGLEVVLRQGLQGLFELTGPGAVPIPITFERPGASPNK
jgi:hypothetical protein